MRHPFLSDFLYFSLKAVFRIKRKIHLCLFISFSFFRLTDRTVRMKTDQYLSIIFLSRGGNQRCHSDFHDFSLKAVVRSERKTNAYVFIYFSFVVVGGEMRHSFLLANQLFLSNCFFFFLKIVFRVRRNTDPCLFMPFPFYRVRKVMYEAFLFDIGSTLFEISHFRLIGHDFCERSRVLNS
jgi:hypothetical protein